MEKSGNLSGCRAPEWCTPWKITWQWKIDFPLSCRFLGGVNRFPPSFCGICFEGLLTMKRFIEKNHWFSMIFLVCGVFSPRETGRYTTGEFTWRIQNPTKPTKKSQKFRGSKFQSSNPIKSYPPRGFPDSICKPSQITSGHTWILRGIGSNCQGQRQRVGWEMSGDQCDLRPGHEDTRGRMGVFFRSMGGKRLVFFYITPITEVVLRFGCPPS